MKIAAVSYSLSTKSLDIYVSGCAGPHCEGCHNQELWDFSKGEELTPQYFDTKVTDTISTFGSLIDRIFIVGGDIMDQDIMERHKLLKWCSDLGKELWLFTRYPLDEISFYEKLWCEYIKSGRYDCSLPKGITSHGFTLASNNQRIYAKGVNY